MASESRIVTETNSKELALWCGGNPVVEHDALDHNVTYGAVNVPCGGEVRRASIGDMIIRKDDGTFDVFKLH